MSADNNTNIQRPEQHQEEQEHSPIDNSVEDPFQNDTFPSPGHNDTDFNPSDIEREEQHDDDDSNSEWGSDLSELSEDRRRKRDERWDRATPEGARRSRRNRDENLGTEDTNDDARSHHHHRNRAAQMTVDSADQNAKKKTKSTADQGQQLESRSSQSDADDQDVPEHYASPSNIVLKREVPPDEIERELSSIHLMWEMAAILDFFHLFRKQLKFQRQFQASELERVLVTSVGDTGLLADIHIDIMRGISPKNLINTTNWQVHLANKIKFHWRNLSDGTPCPFKPEKYYESMAYAELPASQRVRALHFICCVRCDREDVQGRIAEAERPKTNKEIAEAEASLEIARQRASRGTRSAKAVEEPDAAALETLDSFRREPTGVDSSGIAYYYFDMVDTYGFRLYREMPAGMNGRSESRDFNSKNSKRGASVDVGDGDDDDNNDKDDEEEEIGEDNPPSTSLAAAAAAAARSNADKMSKKQRERALRKMPLAKSTIKIKDPPPPGKWELIATNLEELQSVGERFHRSMKPADKTLGHLFLEELVPQLQEKAEAEERRRRAQERVRSRLGVDEIGMGSIGGAAGTAAFIGAGGRSRRERRQVNYAFTEYDDMLRSAIRQSQRRDDSPSMYDEYGNMVSQRRSTRHGSAVFDDVEAARAGMRRGRSAAVLKEEEEEMELDERALKLAKKMSMGVVEGDGVNVYDDDEEKEEGEEEGEEEDDNKEKRAWVNGAIDQGDEDKMQRGRVDTTTEYGHSGHEPPVAVTHGGRGRPPGSKTRKYEDYVADIDEEYDDDDDDDEAQYIPRPSRKRGSTMESNKESGGDVGVGQQIDGAFVVIGNHHSVVPQNIDIMNPTTAIATADNGTMQE